MSPTSVSGGEHLITGGEHISRLVETLIGRFCLRQNLNNGVIIFAILIFLGKLFSFDVSFQASPRICRSLMIARLSRRRV